MREDIVRAAEALNALLLERKLRLVTAESCTGGLIAGAVTEIAGSSKVFDRGFVTYSNAAKMRQLGVPEDLLARRGAVSEEVARAMAVGALEASDADVSVAVTGIAGPGGGGADKPVGLVHIAAATRAGAVVKHRECRFGDLGRSKVREETVLAALALVTGIVSP